MRSVTVSVADVDDERLPDLAALESDQDTALISCVVCG